MKKILMTALLLSASASAAKLQVYPYDGAQFVPGQHFDLRVEAEDVKDFKDAVITLDGKAVTGLVKTTSKDTSVEWTVRAQSLGVGTHKIGRAHV